MTNKLYIHGSFSSKNFGDFLIFYLTSQHISSIASEKFELCSNVINSMYSKYIKTNGAYNNFKHSNVAICTGGGYFGEPGYKLFKWHLAFLYRHIIPLMYLVRKKIPYIIVGVDAGNIRGRLLRYFTRIIFDKAEYVAVRNQESAIFLKQIGVRRKVDVLADMVLSKQIEKLGIIVNDTKSLVIHLPIHESRCNELDIILCDIVSFLQHDSRDVKILIDNDGQMDSAKYIFDKLNEVNKCEIVSYENPFALLQVIADSDIIITSKLHVGICGIRFGKKVISVSNHPKIKRFYNQVDLNDFCIDVNRLQLGDVSEMLWKASKSYPSVYLKDIINKGEQNYTQIDSFLLK